MKTEKNSKLFVIINSLELCLSVILLNNHEKSVIFACLVEANDVNNTGSVQHFYFLCHARLRRVI